MSKITQSAQNPFRYSDTNKRYHTYDYYLRHTFGGKVAKLTLDGGFTCPNIDGTCGTGGCIYCSSHGSGDFTASSALSLAEQYRVQREKMSLKWQVEKCIPYFQAHTNTYAPLSRLTALFEEALTLPDAVGLNIATRADCLPDDVLDYLAVLSERTVLTIELGLQTVHDDTAALINRGHDFATFLHTYSRIRTRAPRARIGVHLIFGLPGEDDERMLDTVRRVAALRPDEVKLHLLYVVEGTVLADLFLRGEYKALERERYIALVADAIELLPPETVLGRLTGDGAPDTLLAPLWSRKKLTVLNDIDKLLVARNTWQGKHSRLES
ncbi:MAG: TIGR01212 family radical SAM protein [Clostridia bacterium]|nr:TIGR01212 family radical SAM protein [Clostridia bacterium]